jgi:hypothetical protein
MEKSRLLTSKSIDGGHSKTNAEIQSRREPDFEPSQRTAREGACFDEFALPRRPAAGRPIKTGFAADGPICSPAIDLPWKKGICGYGRSV